ncbi:hypothetical protein K474DRAFT_171153 [Panus rudis PR-1116 ss-1]|nr:hypothetical protein K474DRAFT_171153 [Panus rudis PR-1116 ss-1]
MRVCRCLSSWWHGTPAVEHAVHFGCLESHWTTTREVSVRRPYADERTRRGAGICRRCHPTGLALIFLLLHRAQASWERLKRLGSAGGGGSPPSPSVFLRFLDELGVGVCTDGGACCCGVGGTWLGSMCSAVWRDDCARLSCCWGIMWLIVVVVDGEGGEKSTQSQGKTQLAQRSITTTLCPCDPGHPRPPAFSAVHIVRSNELPL